jgi:hypothetical protein
MMNLARHTFFALCAAGGVTLAGCSTFTSEQTVVHPDGETVTTTIRARTFFDAKSELARLRTTQTDKTQGVTLGALGQETSGTNTVELLERVVRGAVSGAVGAVK